MQEHAINRLPKKVSTGHVARNAHLHVAAHTQEKAEMHAQRPYVCACLAAAHRVGGMVHTFKASLDVADVPRASGASIKQPARPP